MHGYTQSVDNIINGLTRIPMHPPTDDDLENLPHVIITSNDIWDPTVLDHSIDPSNNTYDHAMDPHFDQEDFASLDDCTIFITMTMALTMFVMSITTNVSPSQDLISMPQIIPIVYHPNI